MWETIIDGNVNWFNYVGEMSSNIKCIVISSYNNTVQQTTPQI